MTSGGNNYKDFP